MGFTHYPPVDAAAAERLRGATVAWAQLLGELQGVGLRPYLELLQGEAEDPLRLYCELDDGLLLDVSIDDEGLPDEPPVSIEGAWVVYVQDHDGYRAEVTIDGEIAFSELARRLVDLTDAVALGEHPFFEEW